MANFFFLTLTTADKISLAAVIISLASVFFTWFSLRLQRIHNHKSVKPIGAIFLIDTESRIVITFFNNGVGPLTISQVIARKGKETGSNLFGFFPESYLNGGVLTSYAGDLQNHTIAANSSLDLLKWESETSLAPEINDTHKGEIRRVLMDVTLDIKYHDVYEKNHYTLSENFAWFGRHFKKG